jgi:hypothetical protein
MSTTEILLSAILVGVMALVVLMIYSIMENHMWETRARFEKDKKPLLNNDQILEEDVQMRSWKVRFAFLGEMILFGAIISFALYHIIKFLTL